MRTIIIKKKILLFKHEKINQTLSNDWPTYCHTGNQTLSNDWPTYCHTGNQTLSNDWPTYCHTGIHVSLSNSIFFICKSNNILYQVTSFTFHSHSETLHFFHYYQIKKLIFFFSRFWHKWFFR